MEVYAKQAKDGRLIAYATEIRKRAERRLGELMVADRNAGKLATSEFEAAQEAKIAERAKALSSNGWSKEFNYLGARALVLELELNESLERIKALEKEIHDMRDSWPRSPRAGLLDSSA
jgi:hypothetical protein